MSANIYSFERPEFGYISYAAYELLLAQKIPHIGMKAENVLIPGKRLIFSTIQEYSKATGTSIENLTANGKISLGCHINVNDKIYILLHNEDIYTSYCENWTNIHEIGHIYMGHENNGDKEEVEAHFFAACFLMPDPVLRYLRRAGLNITQDFLVRYFKVSPEAAHRKMNTLSKGDFTTSLDSKVVKVLRHDIINIIRLERAFPFDNCNISENKLEEWLI